jgi:electron transport complex protein RnfE
MSVFRVFTNGIWRENPIFVIVLGMCPTLATSTSVENAIGMGIAASFVLIMSNIIISMIRGIVPNKIRIPCFIVVIASFVVLVELVLKAYFMPLYQALGIFIPLIVVNCIILGRAEAFASKNGVVASFFDGVGMGLGFTLALLILATIREILGLNKFFGMLVFPKGFPAAAIMILPPGGFLVVGILMGLYSWNKNRLRLKRRNNVAV